MARINNKVSRIYIPTGILFILYFLYFGLFNRYHIHYLEQNQLFFYNSYFIREYFTLPGGLSCFLGDFFTQFFVSSWAGASILMLSALALFTLSLYIFRKHGLRSIIPALIPVGLLAILQSNELFTFDQSVGFILILSFFALYISVNRPVRRYLFFFTGWPALYFFAGGFSIPVILLCVIHESLLRKQQNYLILSLLFIIFGSAIPFIVAQLFFFIPKDEIYTYPLFFNFHLLQLTALVILLSWHILLLIIIRLSDRKFSFAEKLFRWKYANFIVNSLVLLFLAFFVCRFAYNRKAELMMGMDYHVQQAEWDKVLEISDEYPDFNTLIIYYTNLALYKNGLLAEKMFSYPQIGPQGLRLPWERNTNLFFGGEVFYYLSYNSEAYRWAFEAMVAKGINPRSLKRLIITSITNGENELAGKYLNLLDQTLFYRKWAQDYYTYLSSPPKSHMNNLRRNIELIPHTDFISNAYDLNLTDLLTNHPENKMAYEYFMASLLLEKSLDEFAYYIERIADYDYTRLPTHFEEALLLYNSYENIYIMPEGFSFRDETIRRFQDYSTIFNMYMDNPDVAARQLRRRYGQTYWYYLHFIN